MPSEDLPDVASVIAPLLASVSDEARPLVIALAERLAAVRYRGWAEADGAHRDALLACADREEEIASRVEGLHPEAAAIQARARAEHPELEKLNRELFEPHPLDDQYTLQARGERLGASTWRALARDAEPAARDTYLRCADLEERSAEVLEGILAGREAG